MDARSAKVRLAKRGRNTATNDQRASGKRRSNLRNPARCFRNLRAHFRGTADARTAASRRPTIRMNPKHRIIDLVHCLRVLGLRRGWKYWRCQRLALQDCNFAMRWASNCRREAIKSDPDTARALIKWAEELEELERCVERLIPD